jgi:hypothetical protein
MPEILAAVLEAIGYILDLLGIANAIQGVLGNPAQQTNLLEVETIAGEGTTAVTSPISGTHAIWALLESVQSGGTPSLQTIIDLIDALTPVTLPPSQPPDWPSENTGNLIGALVNEPWFGPYEQVREVQEEWYDTATQLLGMCGAQGWPDIHGPWFALTSYSPDIGWHLISPLLNPSPALPPIAVDWTTWNGTDTLIEFLNAIDPSYGWDHNGPGAYQTPGIVWGHITGEPQARWRCLVAEWQLPFVSGRAWSILSDLEIRLPPIWPGLASVVLGTPVALDQGVEVVGPLDGVLLDITDMERLIPYQTMGPYQTYRNLGRFAFYNDDGWQEDWQGVPSLHCQLLPRQMKRAGGLWLAFYTGVTGSVTPFTIVGA